VRLVTYVSADDMLPRQALRVVEDGRKLIKEAKGLGR
jgi:hypothetical protein